MNTRRDLLHWLGQINKHYGLKVRFRTDTGAGTPSASLNASEPTVFFPTNPVFFEPQVMAHEYAHILRGQIGAGEKGAGAWDSWHDRRFDATYREVCLALGVFAIPTPQLVELIMGRLKAADASWHQRKRKEWKERIMSRGHDLLAYPKVL